MEKMDLKQFNEQFTAFLATTSDYDEILSTGRKMVGALVSSEEWLNETLTRLTLDDEFLESQYHSVDYNEITLYRSPDKRFSVRAFIWEPYKQYPVHDHGSWGIIGAYSNQTREKKFEILSSSPDDTFEIKLQADAVISPGETAFTLPLDKGVHQLSAASGNTSITVHVYGSPVRKGYIQVYDLDYNKIRRIYPPTIYKRVLALRAMGSMKSDWARQVLEEANLSTALPEFIKMESQAALLQQQKRKQS